MDVVKEFNGLNGAIIYRSELNKIIQTAKDENQSGIIYRLSKVLNENADQNLFEINLKQYPTTGLNAARHIGNYKEALDDCGRLKPGYKFENGAVVKVFKFVKKEKPTAVKPKATVLATKKRIKKVLPKVEKKPDPVKAKTAVTSGTKKVRTIKPKITVSESNKKPQANTKTAVLPGNKKIPETQSNKEPVGYMLLDSISGGLVASKKTLPELKNVFESLEDKNTFKDMELFVYEVISKAGKNTQGKRVNVDWNKSKHKSNGQLKLLGINPVTAPVGSVAYKKSLPKEQYEYYQIADPEISDLLGKVEKKRRESVVITLAGGEGSMKTRMLFRMLNAFAQNYRCGHASIEEHPDSSLYDAKVEQYLNLKAQANLYNPEIQSMEDLEKLIRENDIIFIDSFAKIQEIKKDFGIDKDLRKMYDGKLFVVIFQLTSDGKMRGGSTSQFDGDIILFTEAFPNYEQNYIYAKKNRYQDKPLHELKYNIFRGELEKNESDQIENIENQEPIKLSFNVIEN